MTDLDKRKLYRLPWSLYDNPVGWVEITDKCNMDCLGCYRNYLATDEGHKRLEDIKEEIMFLHKERNVSEITLAGGEPLLHPDIIKIVEFISLRSLGAKIFTNGKGLTPEFMHQLVAAGLNQITLHIDSFQTRNDEWDHKNEIELNDLRQYYVDICRKLRKTDLSFASMITRQNLKDVPKIIKWALDKKGIVNGLAFFALRQYKTVFNDKKPALVNINTQDNIHSTDIYNTIKSDFPQYDVAAYFGGTANPKSFKWLFSMSVCSANEFIGSISPISMELFQVLKHLKYGRYINNDANEGLIGKYLIKFLCFLFDREVHRVLFRLLRKPALLFNSLFLFRTVIVQAHDISKFGDMDMCEGCPDMTYFKGRLVNSCRLDEYRKYGRFISDLRAEN